MIETEQKLAILEFNHWSSLAKENGGVSVTQLNTLIVLKNYNLKSKKYILLHEKLC